jgi:hypothetical protein
VKYFFFGPKCQKTEFIKFYKSPEKTAFYKKISPILDLKVKKTAQKKIFYRFKTKKKFQAIKN